MARAALPSDAKLEKLSDAFGAYRRADTCDDGSIGAANACIRAQNRLLDACVDCGMPLDGDEFAFAPAMVTFWLVAA